MIDATLTRIRTSDQGTEGILSMDGFECHTLELPWRGNKQNVSCIPPKIYECEIVRSRRHGDVYLVRGVRGRSGVLIHSGNLAGDKSLGLLSHSQGCILLGEYQGILGGQRAVLSSRAAVRSFNRYTCGEPLTLQIKEAF